MTGDNTAPRRDTEGNESAGLRLPDLLMIGAAKSGTTSVCNYLRRHPALFFPEDSEPEFFSNDDKYVKGLDSYASLFADAGPGLLCVEKSTAYTRWPECPDVPKRIAQAMPDVKLVYMLRHPVDRAYSHYVHRVTVELYPDQSIPVTFEEHVETDTMCVNSSLYMKQIEQYLPYFPQDRLLVLFFEDFVSEPGAVFRRILEFAGVDVAFDVMADGPIHKKSAARQKEQRVRKRLVTPFKTIPGVRQLGESLPRSWRDSIYSLLKVTPWGGRAESRQTPPPMRPETAAALIEQFREGNDRLAEFTGRDLSHWNRISHAGGAQK